MSATSIAEHDGKAIAVSTSPSPGPIPVAAVWPICRIGITIPGVTTPSGTILTTACPTITRVITADSSMSASAGTGPVGIDIAGTTGTAAIRTTGMAPMSLQRRLRT